MRHDKRQVDQFVRELTRHQPRVYAFIRALVPNYADAQEVLSETNATLWQRYETDSPICDFPAWACGVARIEVLRYRQRQSRDRLKFSEAFLEAVVDGFVQQAEALDARTTLLDECMGKLPETDRRLIQLKYYEEAPTDAIGNLVGRSTDAVYKALARIRRTLMKCIQRRLAGEVGA